MNDADRAYVASVYGSVEEAEHRFTKITHCSACSRLLSREVIWRRCYELTGGCTALIVLCDTCNTALPLSSAAESQFKASLQRMAASSHNQPRNIQ